MLFIQVVVSFLHRKKKVELYLFPDRGQKEGVQWRRCVGSRRRDGVGPRISGIGGK